MPFTVRPHHRILLLLLLTVLMLGVGPVYAEWVQVPDPLGTGTATYLDAGMIPHKGDMRKVWTLTDFKTVQKVAGNSFMSIERQIENDCRGRRTRVLRSSAFSGNMGHGEVVYTSSETQEWVPVERGSVGEFLFGLACGIEP